MKKTWVVALGSCAAVVLIRQGQTFLREKRLNQVVAAADLKDAGDVRALLAGIADMTPGMKFELGLSLHGMTGLDGALQHRFGVDAADIAILRACIDDAQAVARRKMDFERKLEPRVVAELTAGAETSAASLTQTFPPYGLPVSCSEGDYAALSDHIGLEALAINGHPIALLVQTSEGVAGQYMPRLAELARQAGDSGLAAIYGDPRWLDAERVKKGASQREQVLQMAKDAGLHPDQIWEALKASPPAAVRCLLADTASLDSQFDRSKHQLANLQANKLARYLATTAPAPGTDFFGKDLQDAAARAGISEADPWAVPWAVEVNAEGVEVRSAGVDGTVGTGDDVVARIRLGEAAASPGRDDGMPKP